MRCEYFDCGWCYYKGDEKTNDKQGACQGCFNCEVYKSQGCENEKEINSCEIKKET